jgi:hypothetical protein
MPAKVDVSEAKDPFDRIASATGHTGEDGEAGTASVAQDDASELIEALLTKKAQGGSPRTGKSASGALRFSMDSDESGNIKPPQFTSQAKGTGTPNSARTVQLKRRAGSDSPSTKKVSASTPESAKK